MCQKKLLFHVLRCTRCHLVCYCSEQCRLSDCVVHQLLCHTQLWKRLDGMTQILIKYQPLGKKYAYNISSCLHDVMVLENSHNVSAFGHWRTYGCCAICESTYPNQRDTKDNTIAVRHRNYRFEYKRCYNCCTSKKLLCEFSLMERNQCAAFSNEKHIFILSLIQFLVHDVVSLIANFYSSFCSCK